MELVLFFMFFAVAIFAIGFATGYGLRSLQSEWRRHGLEHRQRQ